MSFKFSAHDTYFIYNIKLSYIYNNIRVYIYIYNNIRVYIYEQ